MTGTKSINSKKMYQTSERPKTSRGSKSRQQNYSSNFYKSHSVYSNSAAAAEDRQLFARKDFLEQLSETTKIFDLKKRPLPGPITQTGMDSAKQQGLNSNLSRLGGGGGGEKMKPRNIEESELFSKSEIKLWKSDNWRKRDKNFGNNFDKLSPIRENKVPLSDS